MVTAEKDHSPKRMYRYERKFIVERMEPAQVRSIVKCHPAMFVQPYPPRYINNIYLDTPDLDYYFENINGVKNRRKARIRWYGNLFGRIQQPTLEYKIKDGLVGTKASYPFPEFALDSSFTTSMYMELAQAELLPAEISCHLRSHIPVLANRYYRWYFATVDRRFRITVDTGMSYYNIRSLKNTFCHQRHVHRSFVVELKYDIEHDHDAGQIVKLLPFSLSKNSKYVEGIEAVFH